MKYWDAKPAPSGLELMLPVNRREDASGEEGLMRERDEVDRPPRRESLEEFHSSGRNGGKRCGGWGCDVVMLGRLRLRRCWRGCPGLVNDAHASDNAMTRGAYA